MNVTLGFKKILQALAEKESETEGSNVKAKRIKNN